MTTKRTSAKRPGRPTKGPAPRGVPRRARGITRLVPPAIESDARLRLLLETTPIIPWEADIETWLFTYVGPQAVKVLGYPLEQWYKRDFWVSHIHPDDRDAAVACCQRQSSTELEYEFEYRMIAAAGHEVWIQDLVTVERVDGRPRLLRGFMLDVTAQRRTQEQLREREMLFRLLTESIDQVFWFTAVEPERVLYVSPAFERIWGRTAQDLYRDPRIWIEAIHPDDRRRVVSAFDQWVRGESSQYAVEYRLVGPDGSVRWILDLGALVRDQAGEVRWICGIAKDISDHKRAEQLLRKLSRHVISAHEDERRRIARELHDDISQELALLTIGVEELGQHGSDPAVERHRRIGELLKRLREVSTKVYGLSRELHPIKLEHLGLVGAIEDLCCEFSERRGVHAKFCGSGVLPSLPPDVRLCLYRVAQEALNNVAKHSGAGAARVELWAAADGVRLTVSDEGAGFDVESDQAAQGLGLTSMKERLWSVSGTLRVHSRPGGGTRIEAWAPLPPAAPELR